MKGTKNKKNHRKPVPKPDFGAKAKKKYDFEAFLHRHFYTDVYSLIYTQATRFTHKRFNTQALLHIDTFTYRRFYTKILLHTDAFTHSFA